MENNNWTTVWNTYRLVDGWLDASEGRKMYEHCLEFPEGTFVEIGSYRGRSTVMLGMAAREVGGRLYAIDPHFTYDEPNEKNPDNVAKFSPKDHAVKMTNIMACGLSEYVFPVCLPSQWVSVRWELPIDVLFIDGEHSIKAAAQDLFGFQRHITVGGVIVIHDFYWSGPQMIAGLLRESPDFEELKQTGGAFFFKRSLPKDSISHDYWQRKTIEFYESINN